MDMSRVQGRSLGMPLELTVSEVIGASIDELIDAGVRFTVVNDDRKDEEVCHYGDGDADS